MNAISQSNRGKSALPPVGHIARVIAIALLRILALLVVVLFAVPVALLLVATAVPAPISILLAVGDIAMVVGMFRLSWTLRATALGPTNAGDGSGPHGSLSDRSRTTDCRVPPPRWVPPKRRGRPSKAIKQLAAQWC
jgi:hypothetical protein